MKQTLGFPQIPKKCPGSPQLVQPDFVAEEVVEEVGDVGEGDVHPD